jgi:predicted ribosomally synthesized peptide with SipW-like signal peptide
VHTVRRPTDRNIKEKVKVIMTAQVQNRRPDAAQPSARRRKKAGAFALAGLVAAAGIAGVVVTSSAYFTDVKEISTNTVTLRGVDIEAYTSGTNTVLTSFDLTEMAPVLGTNATEFGTAPNRAFDVRNISTSPFKYHVEITGISVTQRDGSALPASDSATALASTSALPVIKVNAVRTTAGSTPAYVAADGKSLSVLNTTPMILDDSAVLQKKDDTAGVVNDEAVVGVKFWIEQADIASWSADKQNLLQNLKVNYKIKLTATQL